MLPKKKSTKIVNNFRMRTMYPIQPLVGAGRFQPAAVADIWTGLYEIKQFQMFRQLILPRIPGDFHRIILAQMGGQPFQFRHLPVAAHEAETGDLRPITCHQSVDFYLRKRFAHILPQVRAVASRTAVRTVGDVHRQCNLVRNFLKDNVVIIILHP